MRLHEIDDMKKIQKTLLNYFEIGPGGYEIKDGLVYAKGEVELSENANRLPVKFAKADDNFYCSRNDLITLVGSPEIVGGTFNCEDNKFQSLIGGPKIVHGSYLCNNNSLTSLEGLPKSVKGFFRLSWHRNLGLLSLLNIEDLYRIEFAPLSSPQLSNIITKYLRQGKKGMLSCAAELTKAGFKGNAKL